MLGSTPDSFKTPPALREDLPTPTVAEDQLLVSVQALIGQPGGRLHRRRCPQGHGRA
jgi:hypothetical protein